MSRIGNQPISLPKGVSVTAGNGEVTVKGPKGELKYSYRREVDVQVEDSTVTVINQRPTRDRQARAFHGLTRSLVQNMVIGVDQGYTRKLEINGVGYGAKLEGSKIVMTLGFAHPVSVDVPSGLTVEVPNQTTIVISGCDKQQVGELAAQVRKQRPPEPYKGKGIKYDFETIRRKAGKAFGSA